MSAYSDVYYNYVVDAMSTSACLRLNVTEHEKSISRYSQSKLLPCSWAEELSMSAIIIIILLCHFHLRYISFDSTDVHVSIMIGIITVPIDHHAAYSLEKNCHGSWVIVYWNYGLQLTTLQALNSLQGQSLV